MLVRKALLAALRVWIQKMRALRQDQATSREVMIDKKKLIQHIRAEYPQSDLPSAWREGFEHAISHVITTIELYEEDGDDSRLLPEL